MKQVKNKLSSGKAIGQAQKGILISTHWFYKVLDCNERKTMAWTQQCGIHVHGYNSEVPWTDHIMTTLYKYGFCVGKSRCCQCQTHLERIQVIVSFLSEWRDRNTLSVCLPCVFWFVRKLHPCKILPETFYTQIPAYMSDTRIFLTLSCICL